MAAGPSVDDLGDAATNIGMYLYNMANSPYLPGRDFNIPKLLMEGGVYALAFLLELVPGINDITPGYSFASRVLDYLYGRYLEKKDEETIRMSRKVPITSRPLRRQRSFT